MVLPVESGAALVGSHTGGVWFVFGNGAAICVSNLWAQPNTNCFVVGPNRDQILAFGRGAYATNWGRGSPRGPALNAFAITFEGRIVPSMTN